MARSNLSELAAKLVELGYCDKARVGTKFNVGQVIYTGNDRYLEEFEARHVVKVLAQ